jgi:hypothetical protein
LVAVPLALVVLVGVALTLSIFGALFGVPMLIVAARPSWACLSVGLGRTQPQDWSIWLRLHLAVCLGLASILYGTATVVGFVDLDWGVDVLFWVALTVMLASAIYGGVRLLRSRVARSDVALT